MTIEECLPQIRVKGAMIAHLAESAAMNPKEPDPDALSGVSETCGEIERYARAVTDSLDAYALDGDVRREPLNSGDGHRTRGDLRRASARAVIRSTELTAATTDLPTRSGRCA